MNKITSIDSRKELTVHETQIIILLDDCTCNYTMTGKMLADLLEIDEVSVRRIIRKLRKKQVPIIASKKGYYMIGSKSEMQSYLNTLNNRIKTMKEVADSLNSISDFYEWDSRYKFSDDLLA